MNAKIKSGCQQESQQSGEGSAYLEYCGGKLWGLSAAADPRLSQTAWKVCWWSSGESRAFWSLLLLQRRSLIYCSFWHMDLLWTEAKSSLQPIWMPHRTDTQSSRRRSLSLSTPQSQFPLQVNWRIHFLIWNHCRETHREGYTMTLLWTSSTHSPHRLIHCVFFF